MAIRVLLVTEPGKIHIYRRAKKERQPTGMQYYSSLSRKVKIESPKCKDEETVVFYLKTQRFSPKPIIQAYRKKSIDIIAIVLNDDRFVVRLVGEIKQLRAGKKIPIIAGSLDFFHDSYTRREVLRKGADYSFPANISYGEVLVIIRAVARRCKRG